MAGLTYVCEDDIQHILEHKCIDINYMAERLYDEPEMAEQKVCGRQLIDFLNGAPIETNDGQMLRVYTGNDLTMLSAKCLQVFGGKNHDDYKLCWERSPVAKPFEYIDNRCQVLEMDDGQFKVHCLGPRFS